MKQILIFLTLISFISVNAQQEDRQAVQETIETFFKGFHEQDSVLIRSVVNDKVVMQSIGQDKNGETVLHEADFNEFLKSIISIPADKSFQEVLYSYSINVDGNMANAWTPYSFYFNGEFSHCGVNNFQLIKKNRQWKIIYLIDTRRKAPCEKASDN
ncbi:MAG TPA: nuclear transport factor 2 family protein [Salinimicrobium sp.]|nr:nuclear transport factor 2 family protein [Salinimicrobium sp.]